MKDVDKLICPKCGANKPIMTVKMTVKAVPLRKNGNTYDLEFDNVELAKEFDEMVSSNLGYCRCNECGARIYYF